MKEGQREYYVLFYCDGWKSSSSMGLKGVFNREGLLHMIRKGLKAKDLEFDGEVPELKEMSIYDIEVALKYGHIKSLYVNEEL